MDKKEPWTPGKLGEWKLFWESEMGKEALKKMESLRSQLLEQAQMVNKPEDIQFYVGRAAGVGIVLLDIETGIKAAEEAQKKEAEPKK